MSCSDTHSLSAHGHILPIGADITALTPISESRPRPWRRTQLHYDAIVELDVLEREKRPVLAAADAEEAHEIVRVEIRQSRGHTLTLLYEPEHNLEEQIIREQFCA